MNRIPVAKKRTLVHRSTADWFDILEVEDHGTFISVLCGGVGQYERMIKLRDEEIAAFRKSGEKGLSRLVREICWGGHKEREYFDEQS